MEKEEKILAELIKKFNYLEGKIKISRIRRIWLEVKYENFFDVFNFAVNNLKFSILLTITGQDEGENLSYFYHLALENGIILNIKTYAPKANPVIKTISSTFPGAIIYERELVDVLGTKVEGLPEGSRYPLPDSWPVNQFPLRKDWNADMLDKKLSEKVEGK